MLVLYLSVDNSENTGRLLLPSADMTKNGHFYLHFNHPQIWTALLYT